MAPLKSKIKLKGRLKRYMQTSLYLGFILAAVNLAVYLLSVPAGIIISCFVLFYFTVVISLQLYNRPVIMNELVSFATQYGQVQKVLLRELEIPYAVLDDEGRIIWTNQSFEKVVHKEKGYRKSITSLFPSITREKLPDEIEFVEMDVAFEDRNYVAKMRKIAMREMVDSSVIIEADNYDGFLIAFYLFDETALKIALQEVDDQSLAVGMIYLDNYEEALESVEEVRRSLLIALIDRKVNKYIAALDGICKKTEKDKYMIVLRKKATELLKESKFDLLEDVKTVNIGNEMAVTISIGVGLNGLSYAQNYEFARNAIDLALGRGGDQAVVKTPENVIYFGGKSQQVEKNTRVKARVKAQALREIITSKERVLIMGHRVADVDSFGAAVGIYRIATTLERKASIVLNDVSTSLQPIVDLFKSHEEYKEDMIIGSQQAIEMAGSNTVLVVVDVNKPSITECPELLRLCKSIVVLDHHRQGTEVIENATLSYVEAYASSACEMVSEILQYIGQSIHITAEEADCMYSGIIIDTNNFMSKAGVRTFEAAAFLRRNGADVTRVRKLFRENATEYKAKADAVSQAEIYRSSFAISTCTSEDIQSPTVVGAQAANELLNIKGVKASFVLTEYQNQIFVSARSIDEVNVQVIMEKMGGGGHLGIAGCQLSDVSIFEGIGILKGTLDKMIAEGDLLAD
ncbi:cyclic-di-AMP phosphodiesterase GdpP [Lachnospiraceae bacterium]|jgi:c-di-AMP phosphodiesterase-like protein|nr:DHH family phosphoesterase [Lachnospiraceae bacterium]GFI18400.1 cyclic-di-AMP phosphodiesterase GdpP [Lachnospiraceae bacterium]GFI69347.1 cyclic-di-AMP phosphodiesterase GdpP [Lachnospiraceae bacterium]